MCRLRLQLVSRSKACLGAAVSCFSTRTAQRAVPAKKA